MGILFNSSIELDWMGEAAYRYHCAIHAYVLMTNRVHILATPADTTGTLAFSSS